MGCDIHCHVEVKIRGKWEHYSCLYIPRDYHLFCRMAGVRQYDESPHPLSSPRGLPSDVSTVTKFDADYWAEDGHSHSWLSSVEAGTVQRLHEKKFTHPPTFGYLFGNDIDSYDRFPEDSDQLKSMGYEEARLVFWFDN